MAQLWWFYGNMQPHVPGNTQWFMFIITMHITWLLSAFLIIRRQLIACPFLCHPHLSNVK